MVSTRSPSPAGNASEPASPGLSPRTKLKAMLAAVDGDSDDDISGPIDVDTLFKSAEKITASKEEARPTQNGGDGDDGSEDEEITQPRGRLAARMQTSTAKEAQDTAKTPDNAPNAAKGLIQQSAESNASSDEDGQGGSEDDEDDISALPRRRIVRPARSRTPEPAPDADQPSSPGLFVTPSARSTTSRRSGATSDTEDELPANLAKSDRFRALVARKREERLAKEAEEAHKQRERAQRTARTLPANSDIDDDDVSDITDDDAGRRLTQGASRPARKASKKALEEMNRETQRLSRSLQLAHEAKTKKKISKASLFERFNFRVEGVAAENKPASSSRPSTPVSAQQTDVEMGDAGTPPSLPPPPSSPKPAPTALAGGRNGLETTGEDEGDELLDIAAALAQTTKQGKGKAVASPAKPAEAKTKRQVRVKFPPVQANLVTIDSDDELEITDARKSKADTIFNRLPTKKEQESKSMNALRHLANLPSPPKEPSRGRKAKPSMTAGELQMSLQQRARAQAKLERERRLEYLRSKGITVQTEEERQREREEVEDIVARARQEVEEIMEREREEAKKARKEKRENGEIDPLGWDDSDDDSFQDSGSEEPAEIDLSGSEEEDEDSDQNAVEDDESATNPMLEDEAEEDRDSEEEEIPQAITEDAKAASDDEADELPTVKSRRSKKHVHIVSDDDDDDDDHSHDRVTATPQRKKTHPKSPSAPNSDSPKVPTSVLRSATKTFIPGLPIAAAAPAGLGLTQIFAGTMDDSQAGPASAAPQEFMPSLDNFPDSQFSAKVGQSQTDDNVPDSQPTQNATTQGRETETQDVQLHFSQSQGHGLDSLMEADSTQISELINPTQDGGYQNFTPLKQRFVDAPHSTIETVMLDGTRAEENVQDSPLVRGTGKLRRRREASMSTTSLPPTEIPGSPSATPSGTVSNKAVVMGNENTENVDRSAFKLMEKAAKRKKRLEEKLRKKISEAKEWVEQEAEESEDEYAGLGGADGEDSSEDDEELAKEMIDDTAGNDADEAKLAGFFADRERAADAAHVDKLFRDITTGMLRKRRRGDDGNDFDLSDSDDGGEAKRRMKRRQFAKMQKALFADERIGKIAENPRNAAFLKSIEDRNSDDEWEFGENFETTADDSESQSQPQEGQEQQEEAIPDSQPTNMGRKRTRMDNHASRPAPHTRRIRDVPRPSSLAEVKRSLSTLLDEPNGSVIPATDAGSDSEGEDDCPPAGVNKENRRSSNFTVVDRIALKRNSSSNLSNSSRLAFAASSATAAAGGGAFKVPALLRKATTNSLISNSSSSSVGSGNTGASSLAALGKAGFSGGGEDAKLKKTAGRGSGVNYFARENERRAAVAEAEKRREKRKWKSVEGQKKVVTGLFGAGKFE
ncbi:hypothetical protein DL771_004177 [Monosporascus sp. 5C6A]|nr:hypothetical protein DL771_004177 [Monosporascus sp. 5C6A]